MRLATTVFGLSSLSVRIPALFGAAVYIASCYWICRLLTRRVLLRFIILGCLILNPYLSDFYAVARGYSMAFGFLICAIALVATLHLQHDQLSAHRTEVTWVTASALLGLSFVSNFAFAFIDFTTWAALLAWGFSETRPRSVRAGLRMFAASVVPALFVVFVIASWTLIHWPSGQIWAGGHSLRETFHSISSGSVYTPNGEIANPLVLKAANVLRQFLIPLVCAIALVQFAFLAIHRPAEERARKRFALSIVALAAVTAALLIHWIAFHTIGMLLPTNRLAIYIIPFCTLAAGAVASVMMPSPLVARIGRGVLVSSLAVLAAYYAACLRSSHFFEWWAEADTKEVYAVLAYYNHHYGVTDVPSRSPLTDCLEFYRRASGRESFAEFKDSGVIPPGKDVYPLYESQNRDFIAREHLKIVYHGRVDGDVVVAIRPDLETRGLTGNPGDHAIHVPE